MISKTQFLARFSHQAGKDQSYWVTTSLPPEILQNVSITVKDKLGFENHNIHFNLLVEIIDGCFTEYVEATKRPNIWGGCDIQNTLTHPWIKALANLPAEQRAGIIAQMAIVEILATHAASLKMDEGINTFLPT